MPANRDKDRQVERPVLLYRLDRQKVKKMKRGFETKRKHRTGSDILNWKRRVALT